MLHGQVRSEVQLHKKQRPVRSEFCSGLVPGDLNMVMAERLTPALIYIHYGPHPLINSLKRVSCNSDMGTETWFTSRYFYCCKSFKLIRPSEAVGPRRKVLLQEKSELQLSLQTAISLLTDDVLNIAGTTLFHHLHLFAYSVFQLLGLCGSFGWFFILPPQHIKVV